MTNTYLPRKIRLSIEKRKMRDEIYEQKRLSFEVVEVYSGLLWWKKFEGWVVNALVVEGASCAAVGGSFGTIVEKEISPVFQTKFAAYRWFAQNVKDYDDLNYFGV